jgi:hypothetical protein
VKAFHAICAAVSNSHLSMNQRGATEAQVYDALWNMIISKFSGEYFPTKIPPLFYAFFGGSPGLFNRTAPHGHALVDYM